MTDQLSTTDYVDACRELLPKPPCHVLDPFAGRGTTHRLDAWDYQTTGVELRQDLADMHPRTHRGDSADLLPDPANPDKISFNDEYFDAVVTEPDWDHSPDETLGEGNTGRYPFESDKYRQIFDKVWAEVARVLKPDGVALVVLQHDRTEANQEIITSWHEELLEGSGLRIRGRPDQFESNSGRVAVITLVKPRAPRSE